MFVFWGVNFLICKVGVKMQSRVHKLAMLEWLVELLHTYSFEFHSHSVVVTIVGMNEISLKQ
jgi:hypothetical protein